MYTRTTAVVQHTLIAGIVLMALVFVGVAPAQAADPAPNDDITSAILVVEPLPFRSNVDTTNATSSVEDPYGCGNTGSVWYKYTPSTDIRIEANTFESDYDTILSVFSEEDWGFSFVDCNDNSPIGPQSRVVFDAIGGKTYYFMVAISDYFGGSGGNLVFSILPGPAPLEISVTIDPFDSVDSRTGVATLRGTGTCNNYVAYFSVSGELKQNVGRLFTIRGTFDAPSIECFPGHPARWTATVVPESGKFSGGKGQVTLSASGCDNTSSCDSAESQAAVKLRK